MPNPTTAPFRWRDLSTGRFADADSAGDQLVPVGDEGPVVDGATIKARRVALGLRQEQVAESTGLSQGHISAIESGRRRPSLPALTVLAKVLDCAVEDLAPAGEPA